MTNYEYYAKEKHASREEIMDLYRRYLERYTAKKLSYEQAEAVSGFYSFLHGEPACEALQWKKGDVVRVVGQNDIEGRIGIVAEPAYSDRKTVAIVLEDGQEKTVYGSLLAKVEIPPAFLAAARLQLEAEGYAKIK